MIADEPKWVETGRVLSRFAFARRWNRSIDRSSWLLLAAPRSRASPSAGFFELRSSGVAPSLSVRKSTPTGRAIRFGPARQPRRTIGRSSAGASNGTRPNTRIGRRDGRTSRRTDLGRRRDATHRPSSDRSSDRSLGRSDHPFVRGFFVDMLEILSDSVSKTRDTWV